MRPRSKSRKITALVNCLAITIGCLTAMPGIVWAGEMPSEQDKSASEGSAAGKEPADEKRPYSEEAKQHYNRGHDLHTQGFFNQAIAEYKAALSCDDRMGEAHTNLGLIYAAQRNYAKATEAFRKALALNPNRPNALNGLGTVLYAKNHVSEAMEKWKLAVQIDPRFASAYYNMGNALENEKDFRGAVDAYDNALNINPSLADAYYRIGSIYAKQKHAAQAGILLSKAVDLDPKAEFVKDAKRTLASLQDDLSQGASDEPQVQMNIMAPPAAESTDKTGS